MLVVRQRRAALKIPSGDKVQDVGLSGQQDVERNRKGLRVETPKDPGGQVVMGGESY